jgi:anti-anti-sigma regulatory factor
MAGGPVERRRASAVRDCEMTQGLRSVEVRQLPRTLGIRDRRAFRREMLACLAVERPCIVIDCSMARRFGKPAIRILLGCLEEAMKRNGDVRLAAISPESRAILEHIGIDRLFRIFDTNKEAEESFYRLPHAQEPYSLVAAALRAASEDAA